MNELDINIFFFQREMDYCPIHFVHSKLPVNRTRYKWILENTKGRFFTNNHGNHTTYLLAFDRYTETARLTDTPAFEDPKDLLMYELSMS